MISRPPTRFWTLWKKELKVSFPKRKLTDALIERWELAHPNVLIRLRKENFVDLTSDIVFLYERFGIGFTIEKGFYFDEEKFIEIEENALKSRARSLGMSK